jgi:hypothetical protein
LARDYAARRLASLTGRKVREVNSDQFFLEDALEQSRIDRWVDDMFMHVKRRPLYGIIEQKKTGGATEYRVRFWVGD